MLYVERIRLLLWSHIAVLRCALYVIVQHRLLTFAPIAAEMLSNAQSNYSALHSTPVYLNEMNSAMLRMLSGDESLSIRTVMHPFPGSASSTARTWPATCRGCGAWLLVFSALSRRRMVADRTGRCKQAGFLMHKQADFWMQMFRSGRIPTLDAICHR